MNQEDIIVREVERLAKNVATISAYKTKGQEIQAIAFIEEQLNTYFDLDINKFYNSGQVNLVSYLYDIKKLTLHQIEIIAELIYQRAELITNGDNIQQLHFYYNNALMLFEFTQAKLNNMSTERLNKIKAIKSKLQAFKEEQINNTK